MRLVVFIALALGAAAALTAALLLPRPEAPQPAAPTRRPDCEAALQECRDALDERKAAQRVLRCLSESDP